LHSSKNNSIVVIPARGGSKGIPGKNTKLLAGKPLIYYSIDIARQISRDEDICVSSDDDQIIKKVEEYGLNVPFKRPVELATDFAGTNEVLLHTIDFYEHRGIYYDNIILLQPTSPLRTVMQIKEALLLYSDTIDMVVSVKTSKTPAILCEENLKGYLFATFGNTISRRQDVCNYYEYNGSIYIINAKSLKEKGLSGFSRCVKYLMPHDYSIDIDTMLDWQVAEMLIKLGLGK
jgi:CMP-N,N'-diacetyllegionaminic acid synthase